MLATKVGVNSDGLPWSQVGCLAALQEALGIAWKPSAQAQTRFQASPATSFVTLVLK